MNKYQIVKVENLKKSFNIGKENQVDALKGINLEISKGEIMSIMGPSGSGKTTLLNCISGIDSFSSGDVFIDGKSIKKMNDIDKTKYRASKMGFIFQSFNLIPVLTAIENVEMPLLVNGIKKDVARKKSAEILIRVGLGERLHHKPSELSGGQRQRVTIARALVHEPAVVWADEPTGNLDRDTAFDIFDLITQLNKELDITFVVVTHDQEIANKTQRIVKMQSGLIIT